MLSDQVKASIDECILCWLATVDSDGCPNVSPKEMFTYLDDRTMLVANIASPQTARNIGANPRVCVSFVHVLKQKGFKVAGSARIVSPEDEEFESLLSSFSALCGSEFEVRGVFVIGVEKVSPIVAPSYWMFPETTEASQIAKAREQYGV